MAVVLFGAPFAVKVSLTSRDSTFNEAETNLALSTLD